MKPVFDIRIQFPPSWLQLKEMGKCFVREMESHNKSLHWIFTPLRYVKTSEFSRCCRTLRARQQSPRITIRWVLGAPRLSQPAATADCARRQASLPTCPRLIRGDYTL
jgi:hypothetical protein